MGPPPDVSVIAFQAILKPIFPYSQSPPTQQQSPSEGGGGGGREAFLSLYTARPSFEYYHQVYFVHSGLQDESLQVTISKLP